MGIKTFLIPIFDDDDLLYKIEMIIKEEFVLFDETWVIHRALIIDNNGKYCPGNYGWACSHKRTGFRMRIRPLPITIAACRKVAIKLLTEHHAKFPATIERAEAKLRRVGR